MTHPLLQECTDRQIAKYNCIKSKAYDRIASLEEEIKRIKTEIKEENLRIKDANKNLAHYSDF